MPRARSTASARVPKVAEASRLSSSQHQKQDASATLSSAPKERNITAQGNALGNRPTTNPNPDGAAQGWQHTKIGDVADINRRPKKDEFDDEMLASFIPMACVEAESGQFDASECKKVGEVKKGYTPMRDGDVIFAKVTPCMENGKAAVMKGLCNGIGFGSTEFFALRPKDNLLPEFLFYFMIQQTFRSEAERNMTGAVGLRRVPRSFIEEYPIPLPPLPEQRRIVARIEELFSRLDAGVAALRHAKAQLQRYRQSVLAAAVTGQLTKAWREQKVAEASRLSSPDKNQRQDASATLPYESAEDLLKRILKQRREQWDGRGKYKEPRGYSGENPFDTPPTWALANFEQVSRRVTVGHVGSMKDEYTESGVPFLRGQNVRANRFDPNGLKFVSREFHLSLSKSLIRGGDIAVTRSGDVGIACVIPDELGEANCSDLVLIQGPVLIDPNFAAYYMNSLGRRLVQAGKVGVAITHFNTQAVAAMPLPLPPLAEQHQIVAEVEARTTAIDHLEAELDRQITRSNRLRQSALASAFAGKL